VEGRGIRLGVLLKEAGLAAASEANRKIDEGAVRIDGHKVTERSLMLMPAQTTFSSWDRSVSRVSSWN